MNGTDQTATIRELRTDFRSIKRRIEQYGEIVITDRGRPAYRIKSVSEQASKTASIPDYYARLLRRQPKALSADETRAFWEEERQ